MIEITGDLWIEEADWLCITTNGVVKRDGSGVMGAGCALEATELMPGIQFELGEAIRTYGNNVCWLRERKVFQGTQDIIAFPVKHVWWSKANLKLIRRSCKELYTVWKETCLERELEGLEPISVLLPRPGCGNGGRDWKTEVKPILEELLPGPYFKIIHYEKTH